MQRLLKTRDAKLRLHSLSSVFHIQLSESCSTSRLEIVANRNIQIHLFSQHKYFQSNHIAVVLHEEFELLSFQKCVQHVEVVNMLEQAAF